MQSAGYPYPLDDLALEGVKHHLPSIERWMFDGLNRRFAAIKMPHRRLSLLLANNEDRIAGAPRLLTVCDKKGQSKLAVPNYLLYCTISPTNMRSPGKVFFDPQRKVLLLPVLKPFYAISKIELKVQREFTTLLFQASNWPDIAWK